MSPYSFVLHIAPQDLYELFFSMSTNYRYYYLKLAHNDKFIDLPNVIKKQGATKPLPACPGQVTSCVGQAGLPGNKGELKMYTFSDFTLRYFEHIRRWLPLVGHSKEKRYTEERNPGKYE